MKQLSKDTYRKVEHYVEKISNEIICDLDLHEEEQYGSYWQAIVNQCKHGESFDFELYRDFTLTLIDKKVSSISFDEKLCMWMHTIYYNYESYSKCEDKFVLIEGFETDELYYHILDIVFCKGADWPDEADGIALSPSYNKLPC